MCIEYLYTIHFLKHTAEYISNFSVGNHFFQTLAKMANGLKQVLVKMK